MSGVRDVDARRVQCDEIWSFCYAKSKNVGHAEAAPAGVGDVWTWTAIDSDSKLIISWLVSPGRDSGYAIEVMDDLRNRLLNRVQLTTDGHRAYLGAVEGAFGGNVDYAQLVKLYGPSSQEEQRRYSPAYCLGSKKVAVVGDPRHEDISTSYVERHNLTMRMSMRRFTRLTNAFSKKAQNHAYSVALYAVWFNFLRPHKSLDGQTPAQVAGAGEGALWLGLDSTGDEFKLRHYHPSRLVAVPFATSTSVGRVPGSDDRHGPPPRRRFFFRPNKVGS